MFWLGRERTKRTCVEIEISLSTNEPTVNPEDKPIGTERTTLQISMSAIFIDLAGSFQAGLVLVCHFNHVDFKHLVLASLVHERKTGWKRRLGDSG